jgi:hypothetical protein
VSGDEEGLVDRGVDGGSGLARVGGDLVGGGLEGRVNGGVGTAVTGRSVLRDAVDGGVQKEPRE